MLDPEQQVALRQKILDAEQRASKFKVRCLIVFI